MRFLYSILLLVFGFGLSAVRADNAVPLGTRQFDGKTLTLFAHPAPLRAGPVQFAVMLTDPKTGQPNLDWKVAASVSPSSTVSKDADWVPPCCRMKSMAAADGSIPLDFSSGDRNALMRGARATLDKSGSWTVNLAITLPDGTTANESLPISIGEPAPPITRYLMFFAALPAVAVGYVFSQKKSRGSKETVSPTSTPVAPAAS